MLTLVEWRHYLMGATEEVEIWMDHQNLQYFQKLQKLNRRQVRWVTELAEYHFTLHHQPGMANKKADLLSRQDDHDQGKEDNHDVLVLQPHHFHALVMPMTTKTHNKIRDALRQENLWDQGIATSLMHEWGITRNNGLLLYDGRVYVPKDHALWGEIIAQSHNHITAGHPGIEKTKELIQ